MISLLLFLSFFSTLFVCAATGENPCAEQGITVRNLSLDNKWQKGEGGQCIPLKRNYSFTIRPGENIGVFLDMVCETPFCPSYTYKDYKSADQNGDCRVKIIPGCVIEDM